MTVDPVDNALRVLREGEGQRETPLTAQRRAAIWSGIEAKRVQASLPTRFERWAEQLRLAMTGKIIPAIGFASATAAIVVAVWANGWRHMPEEASRVQTAAIDAPREPNQTGGRDTASPTTPRTASLVGDGVRMSIQPGSLLTELTPRAFQLASGVVAVDVARTLYPTTVATEEITISSLGSRFSVDRRSDRTMVSVQEGEVRITRGEDAARVLRSGESAVFVRMLATHQPPQSRGAVTTPVLHPRARASGKPELSVQSLRAVDAKSAVDAEGTVNAENAVDARATVEAKGSIDDNGTASSHPSERPALQPPVSSDPAQTIVEAERVLAEETDPDLRSAAWMRIADAHRRLDHREQASEAYLRVVASAGGAAFFEEAALRKARLDMQLGRLGEALKVLEMADRRLDSGPLYPERIALMVEVLLLLNRKDHAHEVLERYRGPESSAIQGARRLFDRIEQPPATHPRRP